MKKFYINFLLLFFISSIFSEVKFVSTYDEWKSKKNHFVEYLQSKNQARVIYIGSKVFSSDNKGKVPTVSEGMGYGLLLSYANDDQALFDKFLRYIMEACTKYGCVILEKEKCKIKSFFLMPWMIDLNGEPFWYKPGKDSPEAYFSSGSATDADIQIAWALSLAIKKVKSGEWKNNFFTTFFGKADYKTIFYQMAKEIRLYDIDWNKKIILPGSQWGEGGKNVFFAGYFTPLAFEALEKTSIFDDPTEQEKSSKAYSLVIKNHSTKKLSVKLLQAEGDVYPDFYMVETQKLNTFWIPPLSNGSLLFLPKKDRSKLQIKITYGDKKDRQSENYLLIANNRSWKSEESQKKHLSIKKDRANIVFQYKNFSKIQFSFQEVMTNSAKIIEDFQNTNNTGLVPNIMYFDGKYPSIWQKTFSYDSIRYILWVTPYLVNNPNAQDYTLLKNILDKMVKSLVPFIKETPKGWTLPAEGIDVFTNKQNKGYKHYATALNAPVYLNAYFHKNNSLVQKLGPNILNYSIEKKQPSIFDPPNDSSAYYTACMILMVKALIEEKLN